VTSVDTRTNKQTNECGKQKTNFGLASHALYARPAGKNLHTLTKDMRQAELWLITDSLH